ncbi:hypothetical protein SBOR_3813 [Sclerotinia borealis F-4128]|uniref:Bola-like protein n=1 Tax=Sclerotinia borealis (strain F-4128) TaxID=1432307 RepID=W9CIY8_SCLBF|nr:hypothetical protein SBOR_3813 [Sclerotinia borealis F-4128]
MDKPALSGLRHRLRTRALLQSRSLSLRTASKLSNSNVRAAQNIRSYSTPANISPCALPRIRAPHPSSAPLSILRFYSSKSSSTITGTIGAGADGVAEEVNRAADILVAPDHLDEAEKKIWDLLYSELSPTKLQVQDISGGCGSMYGIEIVSEKFRGLNMLKQQRLVNKVLGEEIKTWHGVQLRTSVPE